MTLIDVYDDTMTNAVLLWQLLAERTPEQSISHRDMPTADRHAAFVRSRPYRHWYVIEDAGSLVGACYITHQDEIGIGILHAHKRQGHGRAAVLELMRRHPGRLLANINPANAASRSLFEGLGFGLVQVTYARA